MSSAKPMSSYPYTEGKVWYFPVCMTCSVVKGPNATITYVGELWGVRGMKLIACDEICNGCNKPYEKHMGFLRTNTPK